MTVFHSVQGFCTLSEMNSYCSSKSPEDRDRYTQSKMENKIEEVIEEG